MSDNKSEKKLEVILFLAVATIVGGTTVLINCPEISTREGKKVHPKQEIKKVSKVNDTVNAIYYDSLRGNMGR